LVFSQVFVHEITKEELEKFNSNFLLELKNKWTLVSKMKDLTEYGDSKFLKNEAKNNLRLIREILNSRSDF